MRSVVVLPQPEGPKKVEFLIVNIQIESLEDTLTVKLDHDIL